MTDALTALTEGLTLLKELHGKIIDMSQDFDDLPEKDIRKNHLEIISSQVAIALINLKVNINFIENSKKEFEDFFNSDSEQIDNYIHNLIQTLNESIIETALFQTELIFRFYYAQLNGTTLADKESIPRMTAILFQDTENNWAKDEAALIPLFWTLRNTIHTGGIYFDKEAGRSTTYKGKEYKFEYGKAPEFLKEVHSMTMVSNLLNSIKYLFESDLIKNLGTFEHPSYHALGY